jgi:flagellar protein FlaG
MNIQQLTGSAGIPQPVPAPRVTGPVSAPASTPPREPEQVQQAVEQIQRVVSLVANNLQFTVDKGTGKTIIRVVDSQTEEVIRQIPTEEVLSIARALDQMHGLLFNGKA